MSVYSKVKDEGSIMYPYIGRSTINGAIVLFTAKQTGTAIFRGKSKNSIGEHCDCWSEDIFVRLSDDATVTLSNGELS